MYIYLDILNAIKKLNTKIDAQTKNAKIQAY